MITADFPNPPRPPMVACSNCGSMNEPDRSTCRNCQKPMSSCAVAVTVALLGEAA